MKFPKKLSLVFSVVGLCHVFTLLMLAPTAHAEGRLIFVSFSTKNQNFERQILPVLKQLKEENPDAELVHGFASRQFLEQRHISTEVLDAFDALFPGRQLQLVNEKGVADVNTRRRMAEMAHDSGGHVYVIGDEAAVGVADEIAMYKEAGVNPEMLPVK
jgi:hypothetical protein